MKREEKMKPRSGSFSRRISVSDLSHDRGNLSAFVAIFNRKLTKRMSSCQMQIASVSSEFVLNGGLKINFRVARPIRVNNVVEIVRGRRETFITRFKFSTKNVLVLPASSRETAKDIVGKMCEEKFRIILNGDGNPFALYEREIARNHHDIYYRRLEDWEKPLELTFIWSLNQERKSLVFADHDPSRTLLEKCSLEQLTSKMDSLNEDEEAEIEIIKEKYAKVKKFLIKLTSD